MNNNNTSSNSNSTFVSDFVNIALALFSWILPDIPNFWKFVVSFALVGLFIVGRVRPKLIQNLTNPQYILFLCSIIVVGCLEVWLAWKFLGTYLNVNPPLLQAGFIYSLTVGLPTALSVRAERGDVAFSYWAWLFCILSVMTIAHLLNIFIPSSSIVLSEDFFILLFGAAIPILAWIFTVIHALFSISLPWIIYLILLITFMTIQNLPFVWIGKISWDRSRKLSRN